MNNVQKLEKENRELKHALDNLIINFNKLSNRFLHSTTLEESLDAIFDLFFEMFTYEEIAVYLMKDNFELVKYRNLSEESYEEVSDIQEENIFDWVILQNKRIILDRKYKEGSYIFLPLIMKNRSLGILLIGTAKDSNNLTKEEQDILDIISAQVTVSIENSTLYSSIDDQKRKLDNIKNYLNNVIENFNEGLIVVDNDYIVTTINKAAETFLGFTKKDILLKNIRLFYSNWFTPEFFEKIAQCLHDSEIKNHMVELAGKYLKFTILPFEGIHKNITGAIIHIEDITTSMELEKLKEIDDFKDQVISNVSHELKTPLTSIRAYTETLLEIIASDKKGYPEEFKEFLSVINDESERLLNLIVEILDTSKLESGNVSLNLVNLDIGVIINKIITGIDYLIKEKKITVVKKYSDQENFVIKADLIKLEQVFYNIISNAIKYNKDGGKIIISLTKQKKSVKIEVEDTGIGIAEKNLEKLFEKFFREQSEHTDKIGGFGLGLNIVKNIIDLHQGFITFKSEKGKGTKVIIKFPYEL
ncbi:MAG: ATP-binding protein [Candidatus Muiribacteriota bacterium]|jgi:PAS domain S-box-containing protein